MTLRRTPSAVAVLAAVAVGVVAYRWAGMPAEAPAAVRAAPVGGAATLRPSRAESVAVSVAPRVGRAETGPVPAEVFARVLRDSSGLRPDDAAEMIAGAMRRWAAQDPLGAWAWVVSHRALLDDTANGALPGIVLNALAARDPERLLGLVEDLGRAGPPGCYALAPGVLVPAALNALIATGRADVAQVAVELWLPGVDSPDATLAAYNLVAQALAQAAPGSALDWLRARPASAARELALETRVETWAEADPVAAMTWVHGLTPTERAPLAAGVFAEWLQHDETAALAWLQGAATREEFDDATWDRMLGSVVTLASEPRRDPAFAERLAGAISDPQRRQALLEQIAARRTNPDAE